ncbi:MAG: mannitol dehydrogenase family protein [Defluviitaleaceae bacterium]|nr:mannitol dehydrogenase family protein [Defluviitaleaceae bacterium]
MKLNLQSLSNASEWQGYDLPKFDVPAMVARTKAAPTWLHMGAGNIFRIFVAAAQQDLLEAGLVDTGIIVYEAYDENIVPKSFTPYDNLTLGVTLNADGSINKRVIASMADAFSCDLARLKEVIAAPSLQMISLTITEKGYAVNPDTVCEDPASAQSTIEQIVAGLLSRFEAGSPPLALVTMDNFAENGAHLAGSVIAVAEAWFAKGKVSEEFLVYAISQKFPWTMIDKITPRPSEDVAKMLAETGYEDIEITQTPKNTFVASFVNAEAAKYLIIEDDFPNGRPPLEKAGVYMTDRETVRKTDQMKVCACLNPLHTILAVSGMLLNIPTISACMKDERLVKLINKAANEALPVVPNPEIIDPAAFLNEVLTQRFPNPFIPDMPARIASDTSQKVPIRFGVTLKERTAKGLPMADLEAIPLFVALWLRYRMGVNDKGEKMELSPDPRIPEALKALHGIPLGEADKADLKPILSDAATFGVDLYEAGLGEKIEALFVELSSSVGAVSKKLDSI